MTSTSISWRRVAGMVASGGGSIILMASLSALRGTRTTGIYSMSKAASRQMARNLAVEMASQYQSQCHSAGADRAPVLLANDAFIQRRLLATPLPHTAQRRCEQSTLDECIIGQQMS